MLCFNAVLNPKVGATGARDELGLARRPPRVPSANVTSLLTNIFTNVPLLEFARVVVDRGKQDLVVSYPYGQTKRGPHDGIDLELADKVTLGREFHNFTIVAGV